MKNDYNIYIIFTLMIFLSLGLTYNIQLGDKSNSDTLMVNNPKISKISPKIHIIGNGGWATFKSEGNCTGGGTSIDPYVISDLNIDAGGLGGGIFIENSDVYFSIKNSTIWNSGLGSEDASIILNGVENGKIENNTLYDNYHGIHLDNSDHNLILNNTILGWFSIGILFSTNSHYNIITQNIIKNGSRGVQSWYTNSNITIYNNTIIKNILGLDLKGVNHTISNNIIIDTSTGIWMEDSHDSKIFRNIFNGSRKVAYALSVIDSDNVKIVNNSVRYGGFTALYLVRSDYSKVIGNVVSYNGRVSGDPGVRIASSSFVILLNNTISFNTGSGVELDGEYGTTDYNNILNNTIHNNGLSGILITSANYTNISNNKVLNNGLYGISIDLSGFSNISNNIFRDDAGGPYSAEIYVRGINNLIYANYFINSLNILGRDRGTNNKWNSSSVGNFWSSYTGVDANDDGIGDTPYNINRGYYDFMPIWWDSPQILVNSPIEDDVFELSPTFNISLSRGQINSSWYTIDNGLTNITFSGLSGGIDKVEWDGKGVGLVNLTFFVNDSRGQIGSKTVQVIKSYDVPLITIHFPALNQIFGFSAPQFHLTLNDLSPINTTWYTSDGGLTNYTFSGSNGTVNQAAWDNKGTEMITLRFYANDSLGFVGFNDVVIWKDVSNPFISINSPIQNSIFGSTSPEFNISIIEKNLTSTWYTLEGIVGTFYFTRLNGTIDQGTWDNIPQGEVTITFYAEDVVGNIGIESVTVIKSVPSPPEIPGYSTSIMLLGIFSITIIFLLKKLKNSKNCQVSALQ